jgi:DNA-binding MarR family transcriptional regulator
MIAAPSTWRRPPCLPPRPTLPAAPFRATTARHYDVSQSVGHQIFNLMTLMRREIEQRMAALDLTDAQWKPLWMLASGRADTANEMARCLEMDAGAVTRLLDRLEAKGLVERVRSDADRRVVHLQLTAAGRAAAAQVPHVLASVNNDMLQGFSAKPTGCSCVRPGEPHDRQHAGAAGRTGC